MASTTQESNAADPDAGEACVDVAPEREVLTWADFGDATRELAQRIADDGFTPDFVIALARGGLIPAGALAYALGTKS